MIKSITSVKVTGRRVIVRAGFDVPLKKNIHTEEWQVADDTRIKDALATIKYLIDQRARIVILSHLGRPEGKDADKSLWPAAQKLAELINYKVVKISDKLPEYFAATVHFLTADLTKADYSFLSKSILPGDVLFLENLRFYHEEQENSEKFIETLAKFGDIYVDEAFSAVHRKEASTFGLALELPRYAGVSLLKEIQSLKKILENPQQPLVVIIGGAKIKDKVETVQNLARLASKIIIGGAVASTFFKALGYEVGKSKVSDIDVALNLLRDHKEKIVLPVDLVVATDSDSRPRLTKVEKVLPSESIFDIGPESIRKFSGIIKEAKTLVWNGPFGLFENPKFAFGSKAIANAFAARSRGKAFGAIGGGETVELADLAKVTQFIDHVSTGGGAMLEFLTGKKLPGIKALEN